MRGSDGRHGVQPSDPGLSDPGRRARRIALLISCLIPPGLTACSGGRSVAGGNSVDLNGPAVRAQHNIDHYADQIAPQTQRPAAAPSPTAGDPGSAKAAADVTRRYFDAIARREYQAAWSLWGHGGAASGMDAAAFARSFARYRSYVAEIGTPTDQDAGAGQVYITIPVRVTGTLRGGGQFAEQGPVILHRVNDGIKTPSPDDHAWRIARADLKRPSLALDLPLVATARYDCQGGPTVSVRFDNRARTASVVAGDRAPVVLMEQRAASGIWYAADGYTLRGKGRDARFNTPAGDQLTCTARK